MSAAPAKEIERRLLAAKRLLKAKEAHDSLIGFTEFTMPDPNAPDDPAASRYDAQPFHHALAEALEMVERREVRRLIVTLPPRHGKSELTTRRFPAWLLGRDPYRHVMVGAYNQDFARDFGGEVRDIIQHPAYAQVFPNCRLKTGSKDKDSFRTEEGGVATFVGRGGSATGRGADYLIIDDPFKNYEEARSEPTREEAWNWFSTTLSTRMMSHLGCIVITLTRWHMDDIVGRLIDPENQHYKEAEAKKWKIINIRAIAEEDDPLGRRPGAALWPTKFPADYLAGERQRDPVSFSALYQQHPSPAEGAFFKEEHVRYYTKRPPIEALRVYAASDHAVSIKQHRDRTCIIVAGIDRNGVIWLLDCYWQQATTNRVADKMLELQRKWRPVFWWAERGHISQSIEPFLRERMRKEKTWINLQDGPVAADKMQRAQSIMAQMALGNVRFPERAPWVSRAIPELLMFPNGKNDDFVDALAHLGLGLDTMTPRRRAANDDGPGRLIVGSLGWIKQADEYRRKQERISLARGGM